MADRRRRRKPVADGGSDDSSEDSADEVINNTLSDLGSDAEGANSEYESADEEDLLPPPAGDPNNPDAKLDDDEDRKNPQYIPKKGTFYEHDDRTMPPDEEGNMLRSDLEDGVAPKSYPGASLPVVAISDKARADAAAAVDAPARPKKSWRGDEGKWSHDKFQEMEQAPKPREELVSVYGYDIRSEEGAPRARRRRRYGRGPNKYTRNWEDLDAYSRPARGGGQRGGRGGRQGPPHPDHKDVDFPALGEGGSSETGGRRRGSKNVSESNDSNHQDNLNQVTPQADQKDQQHHASHTYTNQEYRRSRPADDHGGEDRGGRGRGRGGRGGRGRGRGGRTDRGGWKGKYAGEDGYAHHDSSRTSDDVRVSSGRGEGSFAQQQQQQHHHHQQQQQQQQQQQHVKHQQMSPRSASHKNASDASAHESPRHASRTDQAHGPQQQGNRQQYGGGAQPGYAHQQQQQQQFGRGNQKRYSNQRGARPGPSSANVGGGERPAGGAGSSNSSSSNNPHYTPHPHHNYYYHDSSTTPPPPGPSDRHGSGLVVSSGSSAGPVLYDASSGSTTAAHHVPPATVAIPGASSQFVAPPPPSFVRDPCIAGGGAIVAATVAAPAPVIPRMFTPVSVVGATSAELVSPELDHAAIAAALIAGAPVVTADPQPAVVARAPFIASDPSRMPCQFTAAPQAAAQQFPAPAPQFPTYQSYPPPPTPSSEGTQPQEVYRNGVMYYNTQSQQPQRSTTALQKRPKAAIPIVPPPEQLPGEKKEGSTPTPEDGNQYHGADNHSSPGESLSYEEPVNESQEAREERKRTTVVAVERRESVSGSNPVPDFAYEGSAQTDSEIAAEVDPSDHYAIQQLQLQQQLQGEQDSNGSVKGDESQEVSPSPKTLPSDTTTTTQATSDANKTDGSATETIAVPSDVTSNDIILSEKTKGLSTEDTTEVDGSKFEDSVENLESNAPVPSSKLSQSVACEKVTENEQKETSIS